LKITIFYVGTSLLAPLRRAQADINKRHKIDLDLAAYNCGAPLTEPEWLDAESDLSTSDLVFVIHVTDGENATRILAALKRYRQQHKAVIAFNCMPDLMRQTRMGKLDFERLMKPRASNEIDDEASAPGIARRAASWMGDFMRGRGGSDAAKSRRLPPKTDQYVRLIGKLPAVLKFIPNAGALRDIKNYLRLFGYFLQPTPNNIRAMLLYAVKSYVPGEHRSIKVDPAEAMPVVGIYHPDAPALFETFEDYQKWQLKRRHTLNHNNTIGLLLMRPQIVSDSRRHYDGLIRAIEEVGLEVVPAISTFMDNREACRRFFVEAKSDETAARSKRGTSKQKKAPKPDNADTEGNGTIRTRVSQVVSLTGFSFVGGPAMNDSSAAAAFLRELNVPFRSMVSLDVQTIEDWATSKLGLNAIQSAMQIAIPEIDGATEPFVYGGLPSTGNEPEPLDERCARIARRLARWNRLQVAPRTDLRIGLLIFCFPPNKGNVGTAADLDVFPSLFDILSTMRANGYEISIPHGVDALRDQVLGGNSVESGMIANVAYRMNVDEYLRLCPYASDIEREWGSAPGKINSNGREIFILGVQLGNVFVGIQPTFGYEGDPMRLLAAESASPHHGFAALYTYLEKVFRADAVVHVGTHGSLEFMPGKQVGLSQKCWPDRLIGELPNVYLYSVNNPAEGSIAKRRSYAELISYLTPPIENAGLYKEFASMKDLLASYRSSSADLEKQRLFEAIEEKARQLNL